MLRRVGPKFVMAQAAPEIPPCFAELVVMVDGKCIRNRVNITSGFARGRRVARVLPVTSAAPF